MKYKIKVLSGNVFRLLTVMLCLFLSSSTIIANDVSNNKNTQKRFSVLGLGDSITEGGDTFQSYLFPLWQKLFTAGYQFDFIGPNTSKCRIGVIHHAGFSGHNAEFLDAHIDSIYRKYPADIVLLHTGHNHFEDEHPVDGIIKAQKSLICKIIAINPNVKILVAKVIHSGKLPKYSYIPELNKSIAKMVRRLNRKNVLLVDQAKGFDWKKFTIGDKVHPNAGGAERMAEVWFEAMKKILAPAEQIFKPEIISYKQIGNIDLKLHVFMPKNKNKKEIHPAIIYFFGGGWSVGTPLQFYRECTHYASKGMVAISAEYRISTLHKSTPFESFEDAKDAIRWLRKNAVKLQLDPNHIVASGSSAGGQLAAATGILNDNNSENTNFSSKPNLLMLYYPVIDNSENGYGTKEMKKRYKEISPLYNIDSVSPPTLFILGTKDPLIPVQTAKEYKRKMYKAGVYCELNLIEGAGHPIFYYAKDLTDNYYKIQKLSDNFLLKYGYIN